jgi:uncharacterized protein YjiS (DUF1127 family)
MFMANVDPTFVWRIILHKTRWHIGKLLERGRTRRALGELNEHPLRDIGKTPAQARRVRAGTPLPGCSPI